MHGVRIYKVAARDNSPLGGINNTTKASRRQPSSDSPKTDRAVAAQIGRQSPDRPLNRSAICATAEGENRRRRSTSLLLTLILSPTHAKPLVLRADHCVRVLSVVIVGAPRI
jgi:hypothetical protein